MLLLRAIQEGDTDYETKGLLHESVLPNNKKFAIGESVDVIVTLVNKDKRQITLRLSNEK